MEKQRAYQKGTGLAVRMDNQKAVYLVQCLVHPLGKDWAYQSELLRASLMVLQLGKEKEQVMAVLLVTVLELVPLMVELKELQRGSCHKLLDILL